eukprot:11100648-Ditylum_brightwellii.AAC.1
MHYFKWRQQSQALFAPLVSKFLNEVTTQALLYGAAFNQRYSRFQEIAFSQGANGKQMGLHSTSRLTIVTINFSNLSHMDANDNHGSRFHMLAGKLIEAGTTVLKNTRKNLNNVKRNMKCLKNHNKNKSKQGFKQTAKGV